jgi:hypothetical protein
MLRYRADVRQNPPRVAADGVAADGELWAERALEPTMGNDHQ